VVAVSFATQGIRNHIRLTGMVVNLKIIVLDQLQASSLLHVQISLSEKVLQALVVSEDMSHIPKEIMPPGTQGMNHSGPTQDHEWDCALRVGEVDVRSTQSRNLLG
jgi:hypothetical protein